MVPTKQERLGQHIKRVEQLLNSAKHAALRPFKMNVPQYSVMYALLQEPGLSGAVLARRCMVTPQTMSSVLSTLESRGLVERKPHPIHSHILEARLTRTGRALVQRADAAVDEVEQALTDCFEPAEAERFLEQLARCADALEAVQSTAPRKTPAR
ncbi:DNA-binding MarR family transcriptional regulator [Streptomyces filamentosus]|uniref:MarR family winged helix-turn-helix transcriptional regulator n=1 Tax=Streptomyces filamentosus TaxID=67294 RepID=UPI0036F0D9DB